MEVDGAVEGSGAVAVADVASFGGTWMTNLPGPAVVGPRCSWRPELFADPVGECPLTASTTSDARLGRGRRSTRPGSPGFVCFPE